MKQNEKKGAYSTVLFWRIRLAITMARREVGESNTLFYLRTFVTGRISQSLIHSVTGRQAITAGDKTTSLHITTNPPAPQLHIRQCFLIKY